MTKKLSWSISHFYKPYYFFYYYIPKAIRDAFSRESIEIEEGIWSFKDGYHQEFFQRIVTEKLQESFDDLSDLVFMCIPASTKFANQVRFERFSKAVCAQTGMMNAFPYITIVRDKEPRHLGGGRDGEYRFDRNFFYGKDVILFDDVVTTGHSMTVLSDQLESMGARVVGCISIARTYSERFCGPNPLHPYSQTTVRPSEDEGAIRKEVNWVDEVPFDESWYEAELSVMEPTPVTKTVARQPTPRPAQPIPAPVSESRCSVVRLKSKRDSADAPTKVVKTAEVPKKTEVAKPSITTKFVEAVKSYLETKPTVKTEPKCEEKAPIKAPKPAISLPRHLEVGDFIRFGHFNGRPLGWQVMSIEGDKIQLITKFGITCRPYNDELEMTTWEKSSLRQWLIKDFYEESFSEAEKAHILTTKVKAEVLDTHELYTGPDTFDKVRILSINEYVKYFNGLPLRFKCYLFNRTPRQCWMRNYGKDRQHAAFIGRSGSIHAGGSLVNSARNAVRPVIWIER